MIEVWKDITDYEGLYMISNLGNVKSLSKYKGTGYKTFINEHIMRPGINNLGYQRIGLTKNSIQNKFFIHRLVAQHFIENPERKKEVNHINGDKFNNCVSNLEWCSRTENEHHAWRTGLKNNKSEYNKRSKSVIQMDHFGNFIKKWSTASDIKRELGLGDSHIRACCNGRLNQAYGFKWKFA